MRRAYTGSSGARWRAYDENSFVTRSAVLGLQASTSSLTAYAPPVVRTGARREKHRALRLTYRSSQSLEWRGN